MNALLDVAVRGHVSMLDLLPTAVRAWLAGGAITFLVWFVPWIETHGERGMK